MKLEKLIQKLQKLNDEYKAKHGVAPTIWAFDSDGIVLCAKVEKDGWGDPTIAKKPYLKRANPKIYFGQVE